MVQKVLWITATVSSSGFSMYFLVLSLEMAGSMIYMLIMVIFRKLYFISICFITSLLCNFIFKLGFNSVKNLALFYQVLFLWFIYCIFSHCDMLIASVNMYNVNYTNMKSKPAKSVDSYSIWTILKNPF